MFLTWKVHPDLSGFGSMLKDPEGVFLSKPVFLVSHATLYY